MKKIFAPLLLLLILLSFNSRAQNTSEEEYFERLYHLCKVWGYAKYFHPRIAQCQVEWDEVLLRTIESTQKATTHETFNNILEDMLEVAGEVMTNTRPLPEVEDSLRFNLQLDWLDSEFFSPAVRTQLREIHEKYGPHENCLFNASFENGNVNLILDANYFNTGTYVTEKFRLLALFRYWNAINYFYPYKYLMDQDWDQTLRQFIPPVIQAEDAQSYHLTFRELTTYLNDSYALMESSTFSSWYGRYRAPFLTRFVEGEMVITKVHSSVAGTIKAGDIIRTLDGEDIQTYRSRLRKYVGGSNDRIIERDLNELLLHGPAGSFEIEVENESGQHSFILNRRRSPELQSLFRDPGPSYETISTADGCSIGYINMSNLRPNEIPALFNELDSVAAIIVDLRKFPNGTLWHLVNYLYPKPVNFSSIMNPDLSYPGTFQYRPYIIGTGGFAYPGRLIILFNEQTQGQAELTVMGLEQHPGAIKVGSRSAGADGDVSAVFLPGAIRTWFSGLGIFYPDGTRTQRIGLIPDIEVHPTIQGIREGRDEVLDFVLKCEFANAAAFEIRDESGIDLGPNPTDDVLLVHTNLKRNYSIKIYDASGKFIQGYKVAKAQDRFSIKLGHLGRGVYLLHFQDQNGLITTKKILKM